MSRVTLGLIADTHVPDRRRALHPQVLPTFRRAKVTAILHAGDLSISRVITELESVAPVVAVRGNRDWFDFDLPLHRTIQVGSVRIGLTHGHGNWLLYIRDKLQFLFYGPRSFSYFTDRAVSLAGNVDVVVFGHNHEPSVKRIAGRLVINPGSACCQMLPNRAPSVGLLHIDSDKISAEIVDLE
ncbi:MAG: YfcE family phosphodiesterase [Anaerolineales bacterium]